eukprot:INCI18339.2.p1 GENE.INCI18339.2~~INCI18339.2.p1  ORF type:complete len:293 (+),score=69.54 INCI18339.2:138-1016(+)
MFTGKGKRNQTNYREGGTRGGRSEFKWDSVKNEHYRENYLGHSVMAPVGRWQRGKDLTWFAKNKAKQAEVAANERAQIIAMEKQMRAERLGLVPKTRRDPVGGPLVEHELDILKRGNLERDPKEMDGNRVDGLGAADAPTHAVQAEMSFSGSADDRLAGTILSVGGASDDRASSDAHRDRRSDKRRAPHESSSAAAIEAAMTAVRGESDSGSRKKSRKSKKSKKKKDKKKKKSKSKRGKRSKKHRKKYGSTSSSSDGSDSSDSSLSGADMDQIQAAIREQERKLLELENAAR